MSEDEIRLRCLELAIDFCRLLITALGMIRDDPLKKAAEFSEYVLRGTVARADT